MALLFINGVLTENNKLFIIIINGSVLHCVGSKILLCMTLCSDHICIVNRESFQIWPNCVLEGLNF